MKMAGESIDLAFNKKLNN